RRTSPAQRIHRQATRLPGLSTRTVRRVQPGLRPRHAFWPSVRWPHGIHPAFDAALGDVALQLDTQRRYARSRIARLPEAPRMALKKIGLLGGSFDPVHLAHVELGRAACEHLSLAEVQFIPAGQPWQRQPLSATSEQRLSMLDIALRHHACMTVNGIELEG